MYYIVAIKKYYYNNMGIHLKLKSYISDTVVLLFLRRDRNSKAYKLITQKRWFRKILCGYSLN